MTSENRPSSSARPDHGGGAGRSWLTDELLRIATSAAVALILFGLYLLLARLR